MEWGCVTTHSGSDKQVMQAVLYLVTVQLTSVLTYFKTEITQAPSIYILSLAGRAAKDCHTRSSGTGTCIYNWKGSLSLFLSLSLSLYLSIYVA